MRTFLGASSVEALDCSDYEGAQHVHDPNQPVPETMAGHFDVVFDAGALERIFNFPVAISNLVRMTKVGGRVFMSSPANNFFGHGFYQFSRLLTKRPVLMLVEAREP